MTNTKSRIPTELYGMHPRYGDELARLCSIVGARPRLFAAGGCWHRYARGRSCRAPISDEHPCSLRRNGHPEVDHLVHLGFGSALPALLSQPYSFDARRLDEITAPYGLGWLPIGPAPYGYGTHGLVIARPEVLDRFREREVSSDWLGSLREWTDDDRVRTTRGEQMIRYGDPPSRPRGIAR